MEKGPEFKTIGRAPPEAHKSVLDSLTGLRFNHLKHLPPEWKRILWWIEVPKDPTERRIIGVVNRVIKDVMTGLGLPFFEIPQGNFHIIKREDFEHYWGKNVTGCSCAGQQAMYFNADTIRQNPLIAVEAFCHESIHMVGNMVVEVEKGETEIVVSSYREGLRVFPPQKKLAMGEEHEHFSGLDEAVVAEAAKRVFPQAVILAGLQESLARMNSPQAIERKERISSMIRENAGVEIPPDEFVWVGEGEKGYYLFPCFQGRQLLAWICEEIQKEFPEKYQDADEVFKEFLRAHFTGNLLTIGRLVEHTFGKGSFRRLGDMDTSLESIIRCKEALRSARANILRSRSKNT